MRLKNMPKEEIEQMSYTDLTYQLLKENKKAMTTPDIFKNICELLDYSDEEYQTKIGDYYTSLTIDKRFILLDEGKWDVRDHHSVDLLVEEDEEDEEVEEITEEEEFDNEEELDDVDTIDDDSDLDVDDDLEDLAIIKDEDLDDDNQ